MAQITRISNSNPVLFSVEPDFIEPIKIGEVEFSYNILLKMREVLEAQELSPQKVWVLPNKISMNSEAYYRKRDSIVSNPPIIRKFPLEKVFLLHRSSSGDLHPSEVVTGKFYYVNEKPLFTNITNGLLRLIVKSNGFKDLEEQGLDAMTIMGVLMVEEDSEVVQEMIRCLELNEDERETVNLLGGYIGSYHLHNDIDIPVPNHYDLRDSMDNPLVKVIAVGGYRLDMPIVTVSVRKENVNCKAWYTIVDELHHWLQGNTDHEYRYKVNIDDHYRKALNMKANGDPMLLIPRQDWNYLQSLEIVRKLILSRYFTIASIDLSEFALLPTIPSVIPSDVYYLLKSMMTAFLRYIPKRKQRKTKLILKTCHPRRVRKLIEFFQNTFLGLLETGMKGICC